MGSTGASDKGTSGGGYTVSLGKRGNVTVDEPLVYQPDSGRAQMPQSVKDFEDKHRTAGVEHSILTMSNGDIVEENTGNRTSVGATRYARSIADVLSHNHPRSRNSGDMGGTFSSGDINNFLRYNQTTYRAVASEGTYSITKGVGLQNDIGLQSAFRHAYEQQEQALRDTLAVLRRQVQQTYNTRITQLQNSFRENRLTYEQYSAQSDRAYAEAQESATRAFNNGLISLHNWLINNQSTYGYTYGLER